METINTCRDYEARCIRWIRDEMGYVTEGFPQFARGNLEGKGVILAWKYRSHAWSTWSFRSFVVATVAVVLFMVGQRPQVEGKNTPASIIVRTATITLGGLATVGWVESERMRRRARQSVLLTWHFNLPSPTVALVNDSPGLNRSNLNTPKLGPTPCHYEQWSVYFNETPSSEVMLASTSPVRNFVYKPKADQFVEKTTS